MIELSFELIIHILLIIIFGIAAIMCFKLVKKLYGGKFTSSLPYLLMAIILIFVMVCFHILDIFVPLLEESSIYLHSIQALQLVAGFFLIKALYEIYQSRFATEGFMSFEPESKGGKKK